ncbi:MAG: protein-L-isoaspartate(D-aspartate) O-methyltransferase [Phycisphaerae bacterium]
MTDESHQSPDWEALRRTMVEKHLIARGIRDPRVLDVIGGLPRERFIPPEQRQDAYADRALPIACGQTISQPYIVAYMTERLELTPTSRVLEIGTGCGYQTAVLAMLCANVYTIERIPALRRGAEDVLTRLGIANVRMACGDGSLGLPDFAPFDRIIVTAAAPRVPSPLVEQLADTGILIAPVGGEKSQRITCVERRAGRAIETSLLPCRFVRLIGREGWHPPKPDA